MRNRKTIIVAFLLVAAMAIGVGYAALTDTLTIIGNAHIDVGQANTAFDSKIYFSAAQADEIKSGDTVTRDLSTGTGATADVASFTADDATFTANRLAVKDEYSTFIFTITNDSNVDATITVGATKQSGDTNPSNSNESIFGVTYKYVKSTGVAFGNEEDIVIPSNGGTITVEVTVTVKEPVTSATSATFGIELTATTVDPANP